MTLIKVASFNLKNNTTNGKYKHIAVTHIWLCLLIVNNVYTLLLQMN